MRGVASTLIRGGGAPNGGTRVDGSGDHAVAPHVAGRGGLGDQGVGDAGGRGTAGGLALGVTVAPAPQLLHDLAGLVLGGHVGLDGGVAQQTIVQGFLGLGGLAAGGVHH